MEKGTGKQQKGSGIQQIKNSYRDDNFLFHFTDIDKHRLHLNEIKKPIFFISLQFKIAKFLLMAKRGTGT